jgi:hypothetical protein
LGVTIGVGVADGMADGVGASVSVALAVGVGVAETVGVAVVPATLANGAAVPVAEHAATAIARPIPNARRRQPSG